MTGLISTVLTHQECITVFLVKVYHAKKNCQKHIRIQSSVDTNTTAINLQKTCMPDSHSNVQNPLRSFTLIPSNNKLVILVTLLSRRESTVALNSPVSTN